jgi:hypothetical protein
MRDTSKANGVNPSPTAFLAMKPQIAGFAGRPGILSADLGITAVCTFYLVLTAGQIHGIKPLRQQSKDSLDFAKLSFKAKPNRPNYFLSR